MNSLDNQSACWGMAISTEQYWEKVYAAKDPWRLDQSPYEKWKFGRTLAVLGGERAETALDLGCGEGHFTELLENFADKVVAADVSPRAIARAKKRCRKLTNIQFRTLDLSKQQVPGKFDLIVCSEILYYFPRKSLDTIAGKIAVALKPNGRLL